MMDFAQRHVLPDTWWRCKVCGVVPYGPAVLVSHRCLFGYRYPGSPCDRCFVFCSSACREALRLMQQRIYEAERDYRLAQVDGAGRHHAAEQRAHRGVDEAHFLESSACRKAYERSKGIVT